MVVKKVQTNLSLMHIGMKLCNGKIWLGNCYDMNEKFPAKEIKWGGLYDGTFEENNLQCEHCGLKE